MRDRLVEAMLSVSQGSGPVAGRITGSFQVMPSHFGLAYDAWAPTLGSQDDAGRVPVSVGTNTHFRQEWLERLAGIKIDCCYEAAFQRWKASFSQPNMRKLEIKVGSRLLLGHGNASATEIGLTVHHTWGTPIVPGSSLKGICSHFLAERHGGTAEQFRSVGHDPASKRMIKRPGAAYAALFGAPDTDDGSKATSGNVVFHEAWYVPGSCGSADDDKPFAVDVLTPHQDAKGYSKPGEHLNRPYPNDYTSPIPVGFMTVKPNARFLVVIEAQGGKPEDAAAWTELAEAVVKEALPAWGIGGKTAAGYGQVTDVRQA